MLKICFYLHGPGNIFRYPTEKESFKYESKTMCEREPVAPSKFDVSFEKLFKLKIGNCLQIHCIALYIIEFWIFSQI